MQVKYKKKTWSQVVSQFTLLSNNNHSLRENRQTLYFCFDFLYELTLVFTHYHYSLVRVFDKEFKHLGSFILKKLHAITIIDSILYETSFSLLYSYWVYKLLAYSRLNNFASFLSSLQCCYGYSLRYPADVLRL